MTSPPLSHLRVLDLTGDLGALCGKILADLGADVVRVEPPGGSALRHRGARADGVEPPEAGLAWWAYAGGTRSLVLDLDSTDGQRRALEVARRADIVIESFPPGYLEQRGLGWDALHRENPRAILTSITPFGQDGPYRAWKGPEIVVQAMSGMMNLIGDADRPPVRVGGDQASLQAAGQAVVGTLVAHLEREVTGQGQWVDVSAQVAMLWAMLSESALPPLHGWMPGRDGAYTRAGRFRRRLIFPCRDGFVAAIVGGGALGAATMEALTAWMAEEGAAPAFMRTRDWNAWDAAHLLSLGARAQTEIDEVVDAVGAFVARKSKAELYEAALDRSLLLAPLMDTADLLRDDQLAARAFFVPAQEPRLGREVIHCGPFARLSSTPLTSPRSAPRLGEGARGPFANGRRRAP